MGLTVHYVKNATNINLKLGKLKGKTLKGTHFIISNKSLWNWRY